ncbi:hypothetical protein BDY24DRAFT_379959 [Mrakia frigida]|uniref:uncharacterized protein n=1 Tax=Mrakia frigida TaxID=29902 RepID=UPI003FCBF081
MVLITKIWDLKEANSHPPLCCLLWILRVFFPSSSLAVCCYKLCLLATSQWSLEKIFIHLNPSPPPLPTSPRGPFETSPTLASSCSPSRSRTSARQRRSIPCSKTGSKPTSSFSAGSPPSE